MKTHRDLPDMIAGIYRFVSLAEFQEISGLSREEIRRRAGRDLPCLIPLCGRIKVMDIRHVRAWEKSGVDYIPEKWPPPKEPAAKDDLPPKGDGTLSLDEVVAMATPVSGLSGVYFLLLDEKVVYVGQSSNLYARIASHRPEKKFDSFAYVPVEPGDRLRVEAQYIAKFRPPYNRNPSWLAPTSPEERAEA